MTAEKKTSPHISCISAVWVYRVYLFDIFPFYCVYANDLKIVLNIIKIDKKNAM